MATIIYNRLLTIFVEISHKNRVKKTRATHHYDRSLAKVIKLYKKTCPKKMEFRHVRHGNLDGKTVGDRG